LPGRGAGPPGRRRTCARLCGSGARGGAGVARLRRRARAAGSRCTAAGRRTGHSRVAKLATSSCAHRALGPHSSCCATGTAPPPRGRAGPPRSANATTGARAGRPRCDDGRGRRRAVRAGVRFRDLRARSAPAPAEYARRPSHRTGGVRPTSPRRSRCTSSAPPAVRCSSPPDRPGSRLLAELPPGSHAADARRSDDGCACSSSTMRP